jgi:flagellar biosynthesis protein FlhB
MLYVFQTKRFFSHKSSGNFLLQSFKILVMLYIVIYYYILFENPLFRQYLLIIYSLQNLLNEQLQNLHNILFN